MPNRLRQQLAIFVRPNPAWYLLLSALALTCLGIAAISTVSEGAAQTQMARLVIALVAMLIGMLMPPRVIAAMVWPIMGFSVALLVVLILPGVPRWIAPRINGARSWLNLYVMNFQPSELAKIAFVLVIAQFLRFRDDHRTVRGIGVLFLIMLLPMGLIMIEPDLGSAILFPPALLAMLLVAGAKLRHIGAVVGSGVLLVAAVVLAVLLLPDSLQGYVLKPHQRARIVSTFSLLRGDRSQVQDRDFQQDRALTVAASGGAYGYGEKRSRTIVRQNALPEAHNDMIFAVIVNRWGLAGGLVTLGLYLMLILSFIAVAARTRDPFGRLTVIGLAAFICTQTFINIGMNIGMLPITGITLPLISYGGSSLLATYGMLGLAMNFATRPRAMLARPSFEFDQGEPAPS